MIALSPDMGWCCAVGMVALRDKAERFAQHVDFVAPTLKQYGLGVWLTWSFTSYHGASWVPSFTAEGLSFLVFLVSTLSLALTLVILLALEWRGRLPRVKSLALASGAAATVGAAVLDFPAGAGAIPDGALVIAAALTGMGSAVLMLAATLMLEAEGPRESFVIVAKNSVYILVAYFVISAISTSLAFVIRASSFIVAAALLSLGDLSPHPHPGARHPLTRRVCCAFSFGLALIILGFSLVDSLARSSKLDVPIGQVDADVMLASIVVIGIILLSYILLGRPVDLVSKFHGIIAAMLVVLGLTMVFGTGAAALAIPFGTCRFLLQVPTYALCIQLAAWLGTPAFRVVGPLHVAMCLADVVGSAIPVFLPSFAESQPARAAVLAVIMCGLFVAFVLVLSRKTLHSLLPEQAMPEDAQADRLIDEEARARYGWKERCQLVGEEFRLTGREMDVLVPLSHGLSPSRIAEDLSLSYYTVRAHTRNIYAKTGVHSRQELIDLIESAAV